MENSGGVDKFASLIMPYCRTTASQKEKLLSCPIARESEEFPGDIDSSSSSSEQATGIVMVSLPESSDDFQTPPEQHFYSQNSSNDDQVLETKTTAMDSNLKSVGAGDGNVIKADDDGEDPSGPRVVDLANDSDHLGSAGKSSRVLVDENDTDQIAVEDGIHGFGAENLDCETADTELIDSLEENAQQVFVEMPKRDTIVDTGKRKLPYSVNKHEQNKAQSSGWNFMDSLDRVSKMLKHKNDEIEEDVDIIETAKSRGLTFPPTRWSSQETSKP